MQTEMDDQRGYKKKGGSKKSIKFCVTSFMNAHWQTWHKSGSPVQFFPPFFASSTQCPFSPGEPLSLLFLLQPERASPGTNLSMSVAFMFLQTTTTDLEIKRRTCCSLGLIHTRYFFDIKIKRHFDKDS